MVKVTIYTEKLLFVHRCEEGSKVADVIEEIRKRRMIRGFIENNGVKLNDNDRIFRGKAYCFVKNPAAVAPKERVDFSSTRTLFVFLVTCIYFFSVYRASFKFY